MRKLLEIILKQNKDEQDTDKDKSDLRNNPFIDGTTADQR